MRLVPQRAKILIYSIFSSNNNTYVIGGSLHTWRKNLNPENKTSKHNLDFKYLGKFILIITYSLVVKTCVIYHNFAKTILQV